MVDILHRVGIQSSSENDVYEALTTRDGLAGWWTTNTEGDAGVGGVLQFHFEPGDISMKVIELDRGRLVRWQVVDGPAEWIDTTVDWKLTRDGDYTIVVFEHRGWAEPVDFMYHCSTKWGVFMVSLKSLVENGKGAPAPHDVKIDNWN